MLLSALLCFFLTFSQNDIIDVNYKRSSLHTFMITNPDQEYSDSIQSIFIDAPLIDKFNNHLLTERIVAKTDPNYTYDAPTEETPKKKGLMSKFSKKSSNPETSNDKAFQHLAILSYLNGNNIAKNLVSKWFNRSETGSFNMDLIAERGFYNASDLDVKIANSTERGSAQLADAGEALIKNTFVIVNDFQYTNKEEIADKAKGILKGVGKAASLLGKNSLSATTNATSKGVDVAGKGYVIKTKAHLYRLVWNDEVASVFYNDFWTDDSDLDEDKIKAYNETDIFKVEYIGTETSWADIQSTKYTHKSNLDLISVATVRAIDNVISKLQREFEVFRTKTPLISTEPLAAKIGLKEGLEQGDKYEVLEQVLTDSGTTEYKRLGVIKVEKDLIWDNRYNANEENATDLEFTTFSGQKNKYFAGMLIRQIN